MGVIQLNFLCLAATVVDEIYNCLQNLESINKVAEATQPAWEAVQWSEHRENE